MARSCAHTRENALKGAARGHSSQGVSRCFLLKLRSNRAGREDWAPWCSVLLSSRLDPFPRAVVFTRLFGLFRG